MWCGERGQDFLKLTPVVIAGYLGQLPADGLARPTVKPPLAAVRMLLDYMVTGGTLAFNPAASVRGPKHVKKGKTPVLTPEEARHLLGSIDVQSLSGLRDRALIGVMVFSFARVSAIVGMDVQDYSAAMQTAVAAPGGERRQGNSENMKPRGRSHTLVGRQGGPCLVTERLGPLIERNCRIHACFKIGGLFDKDRVALLILFEHYSAESHHFEHG